jgi:hypothetical protein
LINPAREHALHLAFISALFLDITVKKTEELLKNEQERPGLRIQQNVT